MSVFEKSEKNLQYFILILALKLVWKKNFTDDLAFIWSFFILEDLTIFETKMQRLFYFLVLGKPGPTCLSNFYNE
jgi:hypothetical protein